MSKILLLLMLGASLNACVSYSLSFRNSHSYLGANRPALALRAIDAYDPPDRDLVPWLLERGMILRLQGEYRKSNQSLERAKQKMLELEALSLREQAGSLIVNDRLRAYEGEHFERLLLHAYMALNYLTVGDLAGARVEALQADVLAGRLAEKYPDSPLAENPFTRYVSGLVFEMSGEWDDALIAYRKSYLAYQQRSASVPMGIPDRVRQDYLRMSKKVGVTPEFGDIQLTASSKIESGQTRGSGKGELIVIFANNLVPTKLSRTTSTLHSISGRYFAIALPHYEYSTNRVRNIRVSIGEQIIETELMEDVEAVARRTLAESMPAITARALARMVVKSEVSRRVNKDNRSAGLAVNLFSLITEVADTRSWMSLPAGIHIARIPLDSGSYDIQVEAITTSGRVVAQHEYLAMQVNAGQATFLNDYWVRPR